MVQDPTQFDVLVMPNLYGDILRYQYNFLYPEQKWKRYTTIFYFCDIVFDKTW